MSSLTLIWFSHNNLADDRWLLILLVFSNSSLVKFQSVAENNISEEEKLEQCEWDVILKRGA